MAAHGQTKSTLLIADASGIIGSGNGGNGVKVGAGRLVGLSFLGGTAAHGYLRIYDGATIAGGTQIAMFYCGPTNTGAHFDTMDLDITFTVGLSIAGTGLQTSAAAPLNQVTVIFE